MNTVLILTQPPFPTQHPRLGGQHTPVDNEKYLSPASEIKPPRALWCWGYLMTLYSWLVDLKLLQIIKTRTCLIVTPQLIIWVKQGLLLFEWL